MKFFLLAAVPFILMVSWMKPCAVHPQLKGITRDTPIVFSDSILPGKGLNGHDFLYAGEWDTRNKLQTIKVVRGGKVVWTYGFPIKDSNNVIQELGDASMLKNGSIIFSAKNLCRTHYSGQKN